jgi:hypothetical protein
MRAASSSDTGVAGGISASDFHKREIPGYLVRSDKNQNPTEGGGKWSFFFWACGVVLKLPQIPSSRPLPTAFIHGPHTYVRT